MSNRLIILLLFIIHLSLSYSSAAPPIPGKKGYQGPREMYISPEQVKELRAQGLSLKEIYKLSPSTGTNKVIVIPVEFPSGGTGYTGAGTSEDGCMSMGPSEIQSLFQQVSNYYNENSYGALTVPFTISTTTYLMPESMDYYGSNADEEAGYVALLYDAISAASDINFDPYESIIIFHAGWGEESDFLDNSSNDIWSAQVRFSSSFKPDTKEFREAIFVPEREDQDGQTLNSAFGTICHEYGHQIGLPDLYDAETGKSGNVGYWDLMDSGNWVDYGRTPPHFSAWSKVYLGWIELEILESDRTNIPVRSYANNNDSVYKVPFSVADDPDEEYLLVSYRRKTGYDSKLPQEGILIWHIDDSVGDVDENDVNLTSYDHPRVRLVPCDGSLASGVGDKGDPWRSGEIFTSPESDAYNGSSSGITIYDFSGEGTSCMRISITYSKVDDVVKIKELINYPNPAKGRITTIRFMSSKPVSERSIKIFNIAGELVRSIGEDDIRITQKPEDYEFIYESEWDMKNTGGREVASGIYLFLVDADGKKKIAKMAIIK